MPLLPLVGHEEARSRVARAAHEGNFPHTVLIVGPPGVGKQRFALWIAQLLACEARGTEPCGTCVPCRKVLNLAHPDVHWLVPIPRPKAGEPDKQIEEAAESLAELMEERRQQPLWTPPEGMASHGVASARLLLRRVALTPVEGGKKVFIIGDAERLVPQESSQEAANALLKVMEEPPADTVFILTASDPRRLLPTIRSRTVVLRLGRVSSGEVRRFVETHVTPTPAGAALEAMVATAEGAIGTALTGTAAGPRRARRPRRCWRRCWRGRRSGTSARSGRGLGRHVVSSPRCSTPSPTSCPTRLVTAPASSRFDRCPACCARGRR